MLEMRRLAYIPARGGSKGVPGKNIRPICGKPLLGWAIEAASATGLFDRVMVSTEDPHIAEVAEICGAWVPFLRDPACAQDGSSTISAMCSDKARLEAMGEDFEVICLLQPTSPLCRSEDIAGAMDLFERTGRLGVVSVVRSRARPLIMRTVDVDGLAEPILSSREVLRRQDEPVFYELNGAIYINAWRDVTPGLKLGYNPYAYVMDEVSSTDIDTLEDFTLAERRLRTRLTEA